MAQAGGMRPVEQKYRQVRNGCVASLLPLMLVAGMVYPSWFSLPLNLASLAQNPFNTRLTEATANQLRLTPKGKLIGHLGSRGPALRKPEVGGSPIASNVGWGLGTRHRGHCLLSMFEFGLRVHGVEAYCYSSTCLTMKTTCLVLLI